MAAAYKSTGVEISLWEADIEEPPTTPSSGVHPHSFRPTTEMYLGSFGSQQLCKIMYLCVCIDNHFYRSHDFDQFWQNQYTRYL